MMMGPQATISFLSLEQTQRQDIFITSNLHVGKLRLRVIKLLSRKQTWTVTDFGACCVSGSDESLLPSQQRARCSLSSPRGAGPGPGTFAASSPEGWACGPWPESCGLDPRHPECCCSAPTASESYSHTCTHTLTSQTPYACVSWKPALVASGAIVHPGRAASPLLASHEVCSPGVHRD